MKLHIVNKITYKAVVLCGLIFPVSCFAVQCRMDTPLQDDVMTIAANITVGPDTPIGTIVYKAQYVSADTYISCDSNDYSIENWVDYLMIPGSDTGLTISGGGKVYATDLPGLGVAVTGTGDGEVLPRNENEFEEYPDGTVSGTGHAYYLLIIKTGDVSPGVLNGVSLPSIRSYAKEQAGYTGLPFDVVHLRFAGSINVVSKTCRTPDFDVNLGSYETSKYFKGKGNTTPWIDSSITLEDCPAFYGFYGSENESVLITGSGTTPTGTPDANSLMVSLKPMQSIIDSTSGIMSVSDSDGGSAAKGVGIQIGWGSASGSPIPFNFNESRGYAPPSDGRRSFKIPLAARYIQTESVVSPGRADGQTVFIINYY